MNPKATGRGCRRRAPRTRCARSGTPGVSPDTAAAFTASSQHVLTPGSRRWGILGPARSAAGGAPEPMTDRSATATPVLPSPSGTVLPGAGDWTPPSWDDVVRDHADRVYRLAYRLTGNPH